MLGILVGFRMTREELRSGVHTLIPASLVTAILVFSVVGSALVVVHLTSIDIVTALFAAAPGGLTKMSVVSVGFSADEVAVTNHSATGPGPSGPGGDQHAAEKVRV
jgi:uncharacterized membrane protein AbrB (regulator of aidB expression)